MTLEQLGIPDRISVKNSIKKSLDVGNYTSFKHKIQPKSYLKSQKEGNQITNQPLSRNVNDPLETKYLR